MTPEQIAQLLDQLQQRLNGPAKYVFDLAVRQQIIDGLVPLVGVLICIPLVICGLVAGSRHWNDDDIAPVPLTGIVAGFFAAIGLFISVMTFFGGGISKLLNPEYAALQDILHSLTGH